MYNVKVSLVFWRMGELGILLSKFSDLRFIEYEALHTIYSFS